MYVHPDAQLVEIIDGEEFYSCDPIGFPNYMISRSGILINRTTGRVRIPRIVETRSGNSKRSHAIVNLRQYEYRKTFDENYGSYVCSKSSRKIKSLSNQ